MMRWVILLSLCFQVCFSAAQVHLGASNRTIHHLAVRDSLLCAVTDHSVEVWSIPRKKLLGSHDAAGTDILSAVTFGRGPDEIITGSRTGELVKWNLVRKEKQILLAAGQGAITSIDSNKKSDHVVVGFSNGTFITLRLSDETALLPAVTATSADITTVRFVNNQNALLSGDANGKITLHSPGQEPFVLLDNLKWIRDIAINPDSTRFAIAHDNGRIDIFKGSDNFRSVSEMATIKTGTWVTSLDYYFDGNALAYSTISGHVVIKAQTGDYMAKVGTIVNQIKFLPRADNFLCLILATREGLIILNAVDMKFKQ